MNGVEDHAVCKHAPVPKWHRLQAVHELEDVLALHLNGDAELITLSGKRLLSSEKPNVEADTSAMRVMVKMSSMMLCVMSRISTLASDRTHVTPATMPGRFLPRTVMTTRLEEVSRHGVPFFGSCGDAAQIIAKCPPSTAYGRRWSRAALSQHPACPSALHCDAVFPV